MKSLRLYAAALAAFALLAPQLYGAKIAELAIEQSGGIPVPEADLMHNIQQRKGGDYSAERVAGDLKRLLGTGNFDDAVSETSHLADGSVQLVYKLRYRPRVKKIELSGNQKYDTHELRKVITLPVESPLRSAEEIKSIHALRDFYKDKGYNDVTVSTRMDYLSREENTVKITFLIQENLRLKVDNVTFEGNTVFSNFKLKHSIANQYNPLSRFFEMGLLNRGELDLDKGRIRELYWSRGYLDCEVKEVRIAPDPADPEFVNLHFVISEGEPYTVGNVTLSGNTVFATPDMMPYVALRSGETFNFEKEIASAQALSSLYEQLGYADVSTRAVRRPDFESHKVDVNFEVSEGRRYTIRHVVISGNQITKDKVIRRELATQPGDPVDRNRIEASKARLVGMGYFSKVETALTSADALDEKDVQYKVQEKDNFSFRLGGGFSDVNSLFGMVELSNNNFDLLDPTNWFSGGGQRLRVQGLIGIERMGFNVDFSEPWLFDRPLRFDISGYMNQLEYEYWKEDRVGVRTALTRKVYDDFTNVSLGYKFEYVKVRDMDKKLGPETRAEDGGQLVSQFSLMFDRDTRDSLVEPTSGYNLNLLGAISPKMLGSTNNFYRLEAKGSYHYSFWDKAIRTMVGARIGTVAGFNRNDDVPIFERYFMGGGDSLRGFPFREVSPVDSNGKQRGGQTMMLVTAEVSHPIWDWIRGACFMDMGNVWRRSYEMGTVNMGVGYGLRLRVPYLNAPIKLDLAYPVLNNQPNVPNKLRFHFNMGFTFN